MHCPENRHHAGFPFFPYDKFVPFIGLFSLIQRTESLKLAGRIKDRFLINEKRGDR